MSRVPFRAQQALLFGRRNQKQDRATRFFGRRQIRERPGNFEDRSDTARVIERAVVDRVAALIRSPDTEMIPMRGKNDILVTEFRVTPRKNRNHVRSFDPL